MEGRAAVAAEPGPTRQPEPIDPRAAGRTALGMGGLAALLWFFMGPDNPLVSPVVLFGTANLGLAAIPWALRVPRRWYHVPRGERLLHLLLGVPVFGWLLDVSGWNRKFALPMRQLKITRAALPRLLVNIHAAEGAHAIGFVPHVALAGLALATGHAPGALWILLPGIVLHFYPVLLQRWMTLRVAPLLCRARAAGAEPSP